MHLPRVALTALITILAVIIKTPPNPNWTAIFGVPQALAQTLAKRKAGADRLLEQGHEQLRINRPFSEFADSVFVTFPPNSCVAPKTGDEEIKLPNPLNFIQRCNNSVAQHTPTDCLIARIDHARILN